MKRRLILLLLLVCCCAGLRAQRLGTHRDSLYQELKDYPAFTIYKDNYAVVGGPVNTAPDKYNSNVKYQISFAQRLTNAVLPLDSYIFISYTQKAFWDIFLNSKPFAELNYNPGVGVVVPLFWKNRLKGLFSLTIEHESNGRDSIWSRSWNFVSLGYQTSLSRHFKLSAKAWIPFAWREDNPRLMDYIGYGEIKATWIPLKNNRLVADVTVRKGAYKWKGSVQTNIAFKLGRKSNQYLGFQWYCGNAESLIEYQDFVNMIRFGLIIKAKHLDFY